MMDWRAWHDAYENPDSGLGRRLLIVQQQVRSALERVPPGPIKALSMCAGQGHDLIGALAGHERGPDVAACLVELDERNALLARRAAANAGLAGVRVIVGDASLSDSYKGAVPADLVLVCGVFGNVSNEDIERTIASLPQFCAPNATVIWTRHRLAPDMTPMIKRRFAEREFQELAFEVEASGRFAVGAHRLAGAPMSLREGERLFDFIGFWVKELDG